MYKGSRVWSIIVAIFVDSDRVMDACDCTPELW